MGAGTAPCQGEAGSEAWHSDTRGLFAWQARGRGRLHLCVHRGKAPLVIGGGGGSPLPALLVLYGSIAQGCSGQGYILLYRHGPRWESGPVQ